MRTSFPLILLLAFLTACNPDTTSLDIVGMIAGSSPCIDKRFPESDAYNRSHGFSTIQAPAEQYHVYVCGDTHVTTNRTNWETFIRAYRADLLCPVAIHLGDLIDAQNHNAFFKNALTDIPANPLKGDTLMVCIGNHDIYFNQWKTFLDFWHTSTYYFIVRTPLGQQDLFIILDTAEGVLGTKQWAWLRQTLDWADTQSFRHMVVCSHTNLFKEDTSQGHTSNMPLEDTYALLHILRQHGVKMFWSGHDHFRNVIPFDSLTTITLDALEQSAAQPSYFRATFSAGSITYEFIPISKAK